MGEPKRVDHSILPLYPFFDDPDFVWVQGQIEAKAHSQLVVDHLLDLGHVLIPATISSYR